MTTFENQLICHTSPTLLGIKQANLFSFPIEDLKQYQMEIKKYNESMNKIDIYIDYLYCCSKRVFVIVYRKKKLLAYLNQLEVKKFLIDMGYPSNITINAMISHLRKRTANYSEFPHEIGFFLGYPPQDVFEYIKHKGENFKFYGYWKVYSNEEKARHTFQNYEKCKKILLKKVTTGTPILKLLGVS